MKKFIPTIIAIVLIIIVGVFFLGTQVFEKYSYSSEEQDLNEYYKIDAADEVAIVLQNDRIDTKAKLIEGNVYLEFENVKKLLNDRFYVDKNENWLIYTTPTDIIKAGIGGNTYFVGDGENSAGYTICVQRGDELYIALDYVKKFSNFSYELFDAPLRIQLKTEWGEKTVATIKKKNAVRLKGGVKSPILRKVESGEEVEILEKLETWTKVKTNDALMGYIENKFLEGENIVDEIPVTDYVEPVYTSIHRDYKINLGWHAIYTKAGNDTLEEYTQNTKGLNVISPTWFSLTDNEGNYTSFAEESYVTRAHNKGMEVWALIENLNADVSTYEIMSYTSKREKLINNLINDVTSVGADGINLDFEQISYDAGVHYVEFIRELSIECRKRGIVLSVDNYVPRESTAHYNRKEQGVVCDYVIIMGYDEHWGGGGVAGSVASIDYVTDGIEQTLSEVPSQKVINAVPFYTRVWKTTGGEVTSDALGMDAAKAFVNENGVEINWDPVTCQYYGEKQMGNTLYQVWLEEEESIRAKLNVMDAHNLAGVAEWKLGFENKGIWDTIGAYLGN